MQYPEEGRWAGAGWGSEARVVVLVWCARRYGIHGIPVVGDPQGEGEGVVLGIVTDAEVLKALKAGRLDSPAAGWLLKKVLRVPPDASLDQVSRHQAGLGRGGVASPSL
jgi:CBS domain-containing protein